MDGFETPYEDCAEVDFINCEICNKSFRGNTLYKLHVTSQAHLKNEEALIAKGKIPRQQYLPVFEDIIQYLEYLNIDEPIIGLGYLIEVPGNIGDHSGIKYNCTLCKVYAYISEAVQHVIGRKHRQKYLEKNRPDLVNWDITRPITMAGKIIRAKAEIAERQDGRGNPKPLSDRTKRRLLSMQGEPSNGQGLSFTEDMGPNMPKFGSYSKGPGRPVSDDCVQERYEDTVYNRPELYSQDRDSLGYGSGVGDYECKESRDFSNVLGLQDQDRRPYICSQREELYSDAFSRPSAQKDVLKEFYTEELRREKLAKAQKWPNDIDSHQRDHLGNSREIGPGANQSSYSPSFDRHDVLLGRPYEALSNPGPSRESPSKSEDFSRKISNIPDPFMRFLKGEPSHDEPRVRKRKSRFSDATVEELQTAHETFANEYGPPHPKLPAWRPEIRELKMEQTDIPIDLKQTETYQTEPQTEHSESRGDVLEMLKNIEIENEEEAIFLKEQLCSVLREFKEFKARKAKKAAQTGPSRAVQDYNHMRPVTQQHTQDHYGRTPRENLDIRRAEESYDDACQESYNEQMLDENFQETKHPALPDARFSHRQPYKEIKRWPNKNQPQHAPGFNMTATGYDVSDRGYDMPAPDIEIPAPFPEAFQEPLQPRDYQSTDNFSEYSSSTSHLPMERGPKFSRPPQYSRNLDKITSTLLELVRRK